MDFELQLQEFIDLYTENYELEFKKGKGGFPDSFWETYSAFANTQGGTIIIGVKESARGFAPMRLPLTVLEEYKKKFWNDVNNPSTISHNLLSEKDVIINEKLGIISFSVPKAHYQDRPVFRKQTPYGNTYKRNHEGDYKCTREEINRMFADANTRQSFDSRIIEGFTIEEDIDPITLRQYRQALDNRSPGHPWLLGTDKEFLTHIGAYRTDRTTRQEGVTVGGLLVLGKWTSIVEAKELHDFFPDFQERIFQDSNERWDDRIYPDGTWEANLFQFYRRVLPQLYKRVPQPFTLKNGIRIDDSPLHKTLREALFNTLIHADYSSEAHLIIESLPDAIRFSNPGDLLIPISRYYEGGESICRNKIISQMFMLIGGAEKAGSGVSIILKGWREGNFRKPFVEETALPARVTLTLSLNRLLPDEALSELNRRFGKEELSSLEGDAIRLLCLTLSYGEINHSALYGEMGLHTYDLSKLLKKLAIKGFLSSTGYGRGKKYTIGGNNTFIGEQISDEQKQISDEQKQISDEQKQISDEQKANIR
ncbi:AAA family ATPase [Alloprevotella sp. OH1205_COT-284]|uniref:RNA-binding domain-containing protein n=1 Tax=Alloprevotella sp. OH1205_COT-284 TaxID=2491043 RepID=UPI000F5E4A5A|nr:RNA-binding domain-containing protein [Alloprevotella sp. OH1205_COT-284]RRD80738.1 AAA family ATPase [Alloprevotella sp. OH1205_COT-284]